MPKESQGHLLQNICEASSGICDHSLGSLHHRQHQKGRSCPTESSQICDRRLSLHQQCHCHDREPLMGNPPTQTTASQGHYDVSYCTCHGSYTSLSTPPAFRCCYKRSPVQVQCLILQDQYIQGFLLPVKYPTVEPAARETDKRWIPWHLQGRDLISHTALDSKMFLACF